MEIIVTSSLVVEDGTGVEAASSYVDVVYARAYATARGVTLSATDATLDQYLIKAMDYLESLRDRYKGKKTDPTYSLQWPRTGVTIDSTPIDSDVIPAELKQAQVQLAMAIQAGNDLMPTATGEAFITQDTIGPITTKYSEGVSTSGIPIVRAADALLAPLLNGSNAITTSRA